MTRHILVPLDGSEPAWRALDHAIENQKDGRITVLHVVDPIDHLYAGEGFLNAELLNQAVERGEDLCEQARERLRDANALDSIDFDTAVKTGNPSRMIVEYAADNNVDHIVMGSHGRSGISRLLLGSVAETVVRRAPVSVTVTR